MNQKLFKVRDKRKRGWFWMDDEYLNGYGKIFGPTGIAVYMSLCRHADNETQQCFPAQEKIAEEIGVTPRTVRRYIKAFEEAHIISASQEKDPVTGKWLNNVYTLLDKKYWKKPQDISVLRGTVGHLKQKTVGHQRPNNYTHINNYTHTRLEKPTGRKQKKFPKEDYEKVLNAYQSLRGIELKGKEFDPVMQEIKTMFMSGRSVEDIIGCMKWLASGREKWMENWTIKTVRMKIPFYLAQSIKKGDMEYWDIKTKEFRQKYAESGK